MRLLKKFNQYMLEHHPLTWHSKFIQLMVAGLLFWVISYVCGYGLTNLNVIKYESLSHFYSRSNFVSFHVIYCLVVICLWAIFFYKNNAIKSFYPLQRLYLLRLFLQMFVAFTLLVSAEIPFTAGCYAKTRVILPESEMEQDIDQLNLGAAFLTEEKFAYDYSHRKDVLALHYSHLKFNHESDKWSEDFEYYYHPEMLGDTYISTTPIYRDFVTGNDSSVTVIDGQKYLFFSTENKYMGPDSCASITLVKDFHKLDYLPNLHEYAIINYNSNKYDYLRSEHESGFYQTQIPKIHRWAVNDQRDSIEHAVRGLIQVCQKYDINYDLSPALAATYLQAQHYWGLGGYIRGYSSKREKAYFMQHYNDYTTVLEKYSAGAPYDPADSTLLLDAMDEQNYLFYGSEVFNDMISSYKTAHKESIFKDAFGLLFLGFFMAWLFLFFEFANIISLLISIPVGGVLTIIVAIILIYVNMLLYSGREYMENYEYARHTAEKISFAIPFCVCLLIMLTTIFGLYRKRFNKRVLNILINLSYVLAPAMIAMFVGLINIFSGHTVYEECDSSKYEYSYLYLLEPGFILLYAFVGMCCFFPLIVKWRAKEE